MYPKIILREKEGYWHKVDARFLNFVGTSHILQDAIRIHEQSNDEDDDVVQLHRYIFIW